MCETLIIFSRYPEAGNTKTRMITALGAKGAADLQRQMTEHTLNTATKLALSHDITSHDITSRDITIEVHFTGGDVQLMSQWLGKDVQYVPQVPGDLGDKMRSAFERAFSLGSQRVIIIGIDCPDLDRTILNQAFDAIQKQDLVLGAAADGGYYLIGLSHPVAQLFNDISWGTNQVFARTVKIAQQQKLDIHYLPTLADVDRPEDLAIWQKYI
jgi:uncharacterized protein